MSWANAMSQPVNQADLAKAPAKAIQKARDGIAQELFVILEAENIMADETKRRKAAPLSQSDKAIFDETTRQLDALKNEVFTNGRLQGAYIIDHHSSVPMVFVHVPDFASLIAILSHSKVKSVAENEIFVPGDAATNDR